SAGGIVAAMNAARTAQRAVPTRFMGRLHDFSVAHWDHEPLRLTEARSGPRVCDPQPARFMEGSVFLSDLLTAHEPELHKSLQCRQVTFRFMGRPLSFFACIGTMNYPLTRPSGTLSPRRGRGMGGGGRFMEGFPRKISRIEPLNLVGTARCAVRAAFSGATMPPAASRAGTSQRDVPTQVRFMES